MEQLQRAAVVFKLIDALDENKSWCGETHIQKATYFLQELFKVELEYDFTLYKYGPYSFDLHAELETWKGYNLLRVKLYNDYGASIYPSDNGKKIEELRQKTLGHYEDRINAVAKKLGPLGVNQLEPLATALYVTREGFGTDVEARAVWLTRLKPHISKADATQAVQQVDEFIQEAKALLTTPNQQATAHS
jgi:uncharacterized protein YwgA